MVLLKRTKLLLQRYRIFPKKRLGQNFMTDPSVFTRMTDYAALSQNDVVLDIGAGLGFLTRLLADTCKEVLAAEADSRLVKVLQEQLSDLPNIKIIEGDLLEVKIPQFNKVVSIPPYHISSLLLVWLFSKNFERAVLIFQKEFANRLVASVGSRDYGWLTVFAYYHVEVEHLDQVPKRMFYPSPDVDSIIVRLKPKRPPPFNVRNKELFKKFVKALFTERNRKVRNAVLSYVKSMHASSAEKVARLTNSFHFHDKRVRNLAPEDFGALLNAIVD